MRARHYLTGSSGIQVLGMENRSNANKRLVWLYRQLLLRMRLIDGGGRLRILVEPLQMRLFMSVTPAGVETPLDVTPASAMVMPTIAINSVASPENPAASPESSPGFGPSIATPAAATPSPVTATTTALSVLGSDPLGEYLLSYQWAVTSKPSGSNPQFSANGSNAAKNTTVTFNEAGNYTFTCTVTDTFLLSTTSSVNVTVDQTLSSIAIQSPPPAMADNSSYPFAAVAKDQFGNSLSTQPVFNWSVVAGGAGGTITSAGVYTTPVTATGVDTIRATSGSVSGTAAVTVTGDGIFNGGAQIGNPTVYGYFSQNAGTYTVAGAGLNSGGPDQAEFPYESFSGNSVLIADVTSTSGTSVPATAGIMLRQSLDPTSAYISITRNAYSGPNDLGLELRASTGGTGVSAGLISVSGATWLKLVRSGSSFSAYYGSNGTTWTQLGATQTLTTTSAMLGGLYVSSNPLGTLSEGVFSHVSLTSVLTIAAPATASPSVVTGTTTDLSTLANGSSGTLTYTWSATTMPSGAAPVFSANGTSTSGNTVVTFNQAGDYIFTCTISDGAGDTVTSSVNVTVEQTLSALAPSPATPAVVEGTSQQLAATASDQFGHSMPVPTLVWSFQSGLGSINSTGLYTAPSTAGTATVSASSGAVSMTVSIDVLQSLIVTTTADVVNGDTSSVANLVTDPGPDGISLREAILAVNNTPGDFAITFDISGSGTHVITLTSALPALTQPMTIDATSQPGYAGTPLIEINGSGTGAGANGFTVQATGCAVTGLSIVGFAGDAIEVSNAGSAIILGDYLGLTPAGAADANGAGIVLTSSDGDTIGGAAAGDGNVISGNTGDGIRIQSSIGTVVRNSDVGTSAGGSVAVPNGGDGIDILWSDYNLIGGTGDAADIIDENAGDGILIDSASSENVVLADSLSGNGGDGVLIEGSDNTVGEAGATNDIDLNAASGILIASTGTGNLVQANVIGSNGPSLGNLQNGITIYGSDNTIGDTLAGEGNGISGNTDYGIEVSGASSDGNIIQGNSIGTNLAGTASLANTDGGIWLNQTSGTLVGGIATGAGNLISGNNIVANSADGILIQGGLANVIQGNLIGTDVTGTNAVGNAHAGVNIESSANNIIGGVTPGAANAIAFNSIGVDVWGTGATGNTIRGNSIFGNTSIGIDLKNNGITPNTGSQNATLPNEGMNFPVFTAASLNGSSIALSGYVGSASGQTAFAGTTIDIYLSDDSLSNGQGETYLGSMIADANGNFSGLIAAPTVSDGSFITGAATDSIGDTSEFAANLVIQQPNQAPVLTLPGPQISGENTSLTFTSGGGNALSVADADANGGQEQVTLSIASGSLTLPSTAGITFVNSTANGTGTLSFQGTIGNLNAALDGLVYTPAQDFGGPLTLNVSVDDLGNTGSGGPQTSSGTVAINVQAVAHAPSVSSASTLLNTQTTSGLVITPNPLDGSAVAYYRITGISGGTLYLNDGITAISDGQFITFAQGLAGLKFTPANNSSAAGSFTVQAASTPSIGGLVASPVTATISVDGPAISAPSTQNFPQDSTLVFSSANGNPISISDTSVGSGTMTVELSTATGLLSLGSLAGITIGGGGNGQSTIDFTGTVADINAALSGLTIRYANHFTGTDELAIVATDSSSNATASVPLNVTPIAHTPSITGATTNEDQTTTGGLVITPNPIDVGQTVFYQITNISGGSLFQADGIAPINDGDFISAAQGLAGLKFRPTTGSSSPGGFDVQASLSASVNALAGGVVPASIDVISPTAPVNQLPASQTVEENKTLVFSSVAGNAITISNTDGCPQQVTLTATNGTLALATVAGLTLLIGTGHGDTTMTFLGLPGKINNALNGLTFTPTADFSGSAVVQLVSTDSQSIAINAPMSATSSVAISVTAPPPVVTPVTPTTPPLVPAAPALTPANPTGTKGNGGSATSITGIQDTPAPAAPASTDTITAPVASSVASVIVATAPAAGAPAAPAATPAPATPAKTNAPDHPAQANNTPPPQAPAPQNNPPPPAQPSAPKMPVTTPASFVTSSPIWHDLDVMKQQADTDHQTRVHIIAGTATLVSTGMSVMYFIWAIRAGSILSSFLSSMPAWKLVDPLPILDQAADEEDEEDDQETLQTMVDQPRKKAA